MLLKVNNMVYQKKQNKLKKDGTVSHQGDGGGAPLKYTPEIIEQIGKELIEWLNSDEKHYWLGEFANSKGLYRDKFDEWADKDEKFYHTYKLAKSIQETKLARMGIEMATNPTMTVFALKNVAGWRDEKSKVQMEKDKDGNVSITIDG